jgi:hypothetical protein
VSVYIAYTSAKDTSGAEAVKTEYDLFNDLNKIQLEHWEMTHLYALPDRYDSVSAQVASAVVPLDERKRSELLLRERVTALYIFTMFEQALYRLDQSERGFDGGRTEFLHAVVAYYTDRVLRNPRLLHYWKSEGLSTYFEESTNKLFEERVMKNVPASGIDVVGPFGKGGTKPAVTPPGPPQ